ncbi:hypothetical protein FOL47_010443, partial [Perkinsus chesapeaki]
ILALDFKIGSMEPLSTNPSPANALRLEWSLGLNRELIGCVHDLEIAGDDRPQLFYTTGNCGIIYNHTTGEQQLLQGHLNAITASAVSRDRRWIVTADAGKDSLLVVWDRYTAAPVRTITDPHPYGVSACDISPDGRFVVTLSATAPLDDSATNEEDVEKSSAKEGDSIQSTQTVAVWHWLDAERRSPVYIGQIDASDLHSDVVFKHPDITEIASTGKRTVLFWQWDKEKALALKKASSPRKGMKTIVEQLPPRILDFYSPVLCTKDLKQRVGDFTMTVFLPNTSQVATGTVDGDVVVWDASLITDGRTNAGERRAVKIIRLAQDTSLNVLKIRDNYVVVGSADGAVRFYDFGFKIQAETMPEGKTQVSRRSRHSPSKRNAAKERSFSCEPFMVSTASALVVSVESESFYELSASDRRGHLILQGLDSPVHGLDCHPSAPLVAVSGYSGFLHIWNYNARTLNLVKVFDKLVPQVLKFSPDGESLFVGFTNGHCEILHTGDLSEIASFRDSKESALHLAFAPTSSFCAAAHADNCVYLYKLITRPSDSTSLPEWIFAGKYRSHYHPIVGLTFSGLEVGPDPKLFSIGQDGRLVEYNVKHSSEAKGLFITNVWTISQEARPVGAVWFPFGSKGDHSKILISDDHFKLKVWNTIDGNCRSTTLAPTFGGPIDKLLPLRRKDYEDLAGRAIEDGEGTATKSAPLLNPPYDSGQFLVYATNERILGVIQMPLDGSPAKQIGLVAHPGQVANITTSYEGKYVFTVGGADLTLNQWAVDTAALGTSSALAKAADEDGLEAYIELLEGGREGELFDDMKQFFYYSQVRSQGEATTRARKLDGTIPVTEVPNMMCALGFYPSQLDIQNMIAEIRYSRFFETGRYVEKVTFEEFVKLYINHRPAFGMSGQDVANALIALMGKDNTGQVPKELLLQQVLKTDAKGMDIGVPSANDTDPDERLTYKELEKCLGSLVQDENATIESSLPDAIDPIHFARDLLGFDDVVTPAVAPDTPAIADDDEEMEPVCESVHD